MSDQLIFIELEKDQLDLCSEKLQKGIKSLKLTIGVIFIKGSRENKKKSDSLFTSES